jgi:predicted NAD-dependent protein-ADP-ribosyltransferase YbiA (DUF1768 family)
MTSSFSAAFETGTTDRSTCFSNFSPQQIEHHGNVSTAAVCVLFD